MQREIRMEATLRARQEEHAKSAERKFLKKRNANKTVEQNHDVHADQFIRLLDRR